MTRFKLGTRIIESIGWLDLGTLKQANEGSQASPSQLTLPSFQLGKGSKILLNWKESPRNML